MKKIVTILLSGLMCGAILAGCGNSEDPKQVLKGYSDSETYSDGDESSTQQDLVNTLTTKVMTVSLAKMKIIQRLLLKTRKILPVIFRTLTLGVLQVPLVTITTLKLI